MTKLAHPDTRIGHVHLKVSDLDRAVSFYSEVMGFELQQKFGDQAAFLSAGGYHHHVGLNTWDSNGGGPAPGGHTGLYHAAFLYPTRKALAEAFQRVLNAGVALTGAADHGVSEALYFSDPDGNGIEIYCDRDPAEWPRDADGQLTMVNAPLDIPDLMDQINT